MNQLMIGDSLYHAVHGLCRVAEVLKKKDSGKETISYALVPKIFNPWNLRYVLAKEHMEGSGFHALISLAEAKAILGYFRKGVFDIPVIPSEERQRSFAEVHDTWALAKSILAAARQELVAKDQKRRQILERSARGLVLELAIVLQLPVKEAISQICQSLETTGKMHPLVKTALTNAGQD